MLEIFWAERLMDAEVPWLSGALQPVGLANARRPPRLRKKVGVKVLLRRERPTVAIRARGLWGPRFSMTSYSSLCEVPEAVSWGRQQYDLTGGRSAKKAFWGHVLGHVSEGEY